MNDCDYSADAIKISALIVKSKINAKLRLKLSKSVLNLIF